MFNKNIECTGPFEVVAAGGPKWETRVYANGTFMHCHSASGDGRWDGKARHKMGFLARRKHREVLAQLCEYERKFAVAN